MKNLKVIIVLLLIGVAGVYVVYYRQQKPVVIKTTTKTELVKGREEVSYFKGKEVESQKLKVESGKIVLS